jgi:hypothetical protein
VLEIVVRVNKKNDIGTLDRIAGNQGTLKKH